MDFPKVCRNVEIYKHRAKLAAIEIYAVQKQMLAKWPLEKTM